MESYDNYIFVNKELNYLEMYKESSNNVFQSSDNLIDPERNSGECGFRKEMVYHLYDPEIYPYETYNIVVLDYIFDKFDIETRNIPAKYSKTPFKITGTECDVLLKINIDNLVEKTHEIKYIKFEYDFDNIINSRDNYYFDVAHIYIQGKDIINDLFKHAKENVPAIVKEIDSKYYEEHKKEFRWE